MPVGAPSAMTDTEAQRIAQTVAALHEWAIASLQLIGRNVVDTIEAGGFVVGDIVEVKR